MKLKGYSMTALNLGGLNVLPATPDRNLLQCSICEFTSAEMFYCGCFHIYCNTCLLVLNDSSLKGEVLSASCVLCQSATTCMKVNVREAFLSQLSVLCPYCNAVLLLKELKVHLRSCTRCPLAELASVSSGEEKATSNNENEFVDESSSDTTECISGHFDNLSLNSELDAKGQDDASDSAPTTNASTPQVRWQNYELVLVNTSTMADSIRMFNASCKPVANTVLSFWAYSNRQDVHMRATVAGAGVQEGHIHDVTVSEVTLGVPGSSLRSTICDIKVGKLVTFENVLIDHPYEGTLIEVEVRSESLE